MTVTGVPREFAEPRIAASAWGAPFVLGLLLALLGLFAIIAAGFAGLMSVLVLGVFLVIGGIFEIVSSFRTRRHGMFLLPLLSGIFSIVVGALFLYRPLIGLAALGLLLAAFFFASGLFRGITSVVDRYPRWGWDFFYGILAVALGVIIVAGWPITSMWVVGVLVGAELLFRGSALMGAALQLRRTLHAPPVTGPRTSAHAPV